jgi:hypothetical protein
LSTSAASDIAATIARIRNVMTTGWLITDVLRREVAKTCLLVKGLMNDG